MLVSCATHETYYPKCSWCVQATKVTRAQLWRKRIKDVREIVAHLVKWPN